MEFVTIHHLSRELNIPERVIRYRLIHLIMEGKLKEHEDFRRDDFKDEQHFLWKINPLSFMRETALKPVTLVNKTDNQLLPTVDQPNNINPETKNSVNHTDNNSSSSVNEMGNKTVTKEPSLEREMIDLLKEQVKVKDGQLKEQGEQLKDLNDLNVKLTGTMLQQNQKIENLLRLTGGKSDMVIKEENPADPPPDHAQSDGMAV